MHSLIHTLDPQEDRCTLTLTLTHTRTHNRVGKTLVSTRVQVKSFGGILNISWAILSYVG